MKQKLLFLIALVLAIAQGMAAENGNDIPLNAARAECFTAIVGQFNSRTISFSFNPNTVVRMPMMDKESLWQDIDVVTTLGYSVAIDGTDKQMFSAIITSARTSMTTYDVIMSVRVVYSPKAEGTHQATLKIINQKGEAKYTINLEGTGIIIHKGDANCDGQVNVADATSLIDYILNGDSTGIDLDAADVDGDGRITVADVSAIMDIILGVPDIRQCTFLIISMADGNMEEFMIDEKTKVNIEKPNLYIHVNGETKQYSLEDLSQLRYEQRMVSFDNKAALQSLLPALGVFTRTSSTPKTEQP